MEYKEDNNIMKNENSESESENEVFCLSDADDEEVLFNV